MECNIKYRNELVGDDIEADDDDTWHLCVTTAYKHPDHVTPNL